MKKIYSDITVILTVILSLIFIPYVTKIGVFEGKCTIYQTIMLSSKVYDNINNGIRTTTALSGIIFMISVILLYVPDFLLFHEKKQKSIISLIIHTICMIMLFLFYNSCQYMFMLMMLCTCLISSILLQLIEKYDNRLNWFIAIASIFIFMGNIYSLFLHYNMRGMLDNVYFADGSLDRVLDDMVSISRINILCLGLWIIPITILLFHEIKQNKWR